MKQHISKIYGTVEEKPTTEKPPRKQLNLKAILGDSSWQGISAVISIISLAATIFLTIMVFNWTREQTLANVDVRAGQSGSSSYSVHPSYYFVVENQGPAVARKLLIDAYFVGTTSPSFRCNLDDTTNNIDLGRFEQPGVMMVSKDSKPYMIRFHVYALKVDGFYEISCASDADENILLSKIEIYVSGKNVNKYHFTHVIEDNPDSLPFATPVPTPFPTYLPEYLRPTSGSDPSPQPESTSTSSSYPSPYPSQ